MAFLILTFLMSLTQLNIPDVLIFAKFNPLKLTFVKFVSPLNKSCMSVICAISSPDKSTFLRLGMLLNRPAILMTLGETLIPFRLTEGM